MVQNNLFQKIMKAFLLKKVDSQQGMGNNNLIKHVQKKTYHNIWFPTKLNCRLNHKESIRMLNQQHCNGHRVQVKNALVQSLVAMTAGNCTRSFPSQWHFNFACVSWFLQLSLKIREIFLSLVCVTIEAQ